MSVAILVLVASLDRSIAEALKDMSGPAPIRVVGPLTRGGVDPSVVDRVAATDGVSAAVPVVQAVAIAQQVGGDPTHIVALGVDCRIEALIGEFGCDDPAMNPATRRASAHLGRPRESRSAPAPTSAPTWVAFRSRVRSSNDALDDINGGRIAIFDLKTAQRVFDRGENVDAVYVRPGAGVNVEQLVERLRPAVGAHNLVLLKRRAVAVDVDAAAR